MWVCLVDPKFAFDALQALRQIKEAGMSEVSEGDLNAIREDVSRTYVGGLSVLSAPNRERQLTNLLSLFVCKRPDIGYESGMNFVMAVLLSVFSTESDAFVMFCHIIENVYPEVICNQSYFKEEERNLICHRELRILSLMAERLRPRLVKSLKAIFRSEATKPSQSDFSPFVTTIKRIGDVWFSTLFCTMLVPGDLLRVWDVLLIYGFEFVHKFALVLLSKNEKFLRNNIKNETKSLNVGMSVDALIIAGNNTRVRLQKRVEKIPIEQLIKKALSKPSYTALRRADFMQEAEKIESSHMDRLLRLRQTKKLLQDSELSFEEVINMFRAFDQIQVNGNVSRALFMTKATKEFAWSALTALNIFTLLDQTGSDSLEIRELKAGIAMLFNGTLEEKLKLCFHAFDQDGSGYLEPNEVIDMIALMESTLDGRSSFFRKQSTGLYQMMDRNEDNKISVEEFIRSALQDSGAKPILSYISAIDAETEEPVADMRMIALFNEEGEFEDVHSPISGSDASGHTSDYEEEIDRPNPLESLLESDLKELQIERPSEDQRSSPSLYTGTRTLEPDFEAEPRASVREAELSDQSSSKSSDEHSDSYKETLVVPDFPKPSEAKSSRSSCNRLCSPQTCNIS